MRTEYLSTINLQNEAIGELEGEVKVLNAKVRKLESQVDDVDTYERRGTIIISGTAAPTGTHGRSVQVLLRTLSRRSYDWKYQATKLTLRTDLAKNQLTRRQIVGASLSSFVGVTANAASFRLQERRRTLGSS